MVASVVISKKGDDEFEPTSTNVKIKIITFVVPPGLEKRMAIIENRLEFSSYDGWGGGRRTNNLTAPHTTIYYNLYGIIK